jgi:uncharacterized protein with HEPN domain
MPFDKTHLALLDIRDNILAAQRFTAGLSADEFETSQLHFYAVTRALEIVSEAARRLPDGFREKHADLPWRQIMGAGNVYRHNYDNVQESFVWATVQDHLAPLLAAVIAELANFEAS